MGIEAIAVLEFMERQTVLAFCVNKVFPAVIKGTITGWRICENDFFS